MAARNELLEVAGREVTISNPEKVFFARAVGARWSSGQHEVSNFGARVPHAHLDVGIEVTTHFGEDGARLDEAAAMKCADAAVEGAKPLSRNSYKVQLVKAAVKRAILEAREA